jgi:hypothetical protein
LEKKNQFSNIENLKRKKKGEKKTIDAHPQL